VAPTEAPARPAEAPPQQKPGEPEKKPDDDIDEQVKRIIRELPDPTPQPGGE